MRGLSENCSIILYWFKAMSGSLEGREAGSTHDARRIAVETAIRVSAEDVNSRETNYSYDSVIR